MTEITFAAALLLMIAASFIGGAVSAWFLKQRGAGRPLFIPMEIKVNIKVIDGKGYMTLSHDFDLKTSEASADLIMHWLDREGMVAMPKGFDFTKKVKAKS